MGGVDLSQSAAKDLHQNLLEAIGDLTDEKLPLRLPDKGLAQK